MGKYDIAKITNDIGKNSCVMEWDGCPIYYDNFTKTLKDSRGSIGDITGSVLKNIHEEVEYHLTSNRISAGQNTLYIMSKILKIISNPISMKEICEMQYERFRGNDVWVECYNKQYEYFSKFEKFEEKAYPTLIFDEIDKSLDIKTIFEIYTEFFPALVKNFNNQIIMISHSPLILSENIINNEFYNIISIDEEYTNDVKPLLKNIKF